MERKQKQELYSVLILFFVFLFSVSFPFALIIKNDLVVYICSLSIRVAFIVFAIIFIYKEQLPSFKFKAIDWKLILFIPLFAGCLSNFIYCYFDKAELLNTFSWATFGKNAAMIFVSALSEEIVFRVVIYAEFAKKFKKIIAVIFSSLIFGSIHLLNINSLASIPYCLIQMVYATCLGLVVGLLYAYSDNFVLPFIYHLLFNICNDELSTSLFNIEWNKTFYVTNILVVVILAIYGLLIYFFVLKKEDELNAA